MSLARLELVDFALSPAVTVGVHRVAVAGVSLPRRARPGRWTPRWSEVGHLVLDQPTIDTLRLAARAVLHDENLLLEGDTATSKTSALLYLAALCNADVVRLNLSAQTEVGDLVGRFVPNPARGLSVPELARHRAALSPDSQALLAAAEASGRDLDRVEQLLIGRAEGWPAVPDQPWLFQEGPLIRALRSGAWVILDELALAPSDILERLNSLLEQPRSLLLTEGDGTRFGAGGDEPIHPDFRIFATSNPAEYAGRAVLSPALLSRFTLTRVVPPSTEAEYRAMLRGLVFGEQPAVAVAGTRLAGQTGLPTIGACPALAACDGLEPLLDRLAMLHAKLALVTAGDEPSLGGQRRQRYIVSRRDLLTILRLLEADLPLGEQLGFLVAQAVATVFGERLGNDADRRQYEAIVLALGLADEPPLQGQVRQLTLQVAGEWQQLSDVLGPGEVAELPLPMAAGQELHLTTSPPHGQASFDTLLELYDQTGEVVARDDDGGLGTTSDLRYRVPVDGVWRARLSGFGGHGSFTLACLVAGAPPVPNLVPGEAWQQISGRVTAHGRASYRLEARVGRHTFTTSPGNHGDGSGRGSCDFDTVLTILDPSGKPLARDDDGGEGLSSLLRWTCRQAGLYEVQVTGHGASAGSFVLGYRRLSNSPRTAPAREGLAAEPAGPLPGPESEHAPEDPSAAHPEPLLDELEEGRDDEDRLAGDPEPPLDDLDDDDDEEVDPMER